ncbi:DUF4387 domain-containing protein [Oceanobacillus luteolus]|uniref:DUF4387 domain-containing protein n=1 Tax=Oceanobacillus luteolus TaxID=1274358 RepID=UPI00203F50D8|nr:DUF4387 domain-containing protein [Oceanobacillus luteolus]MCM3740583.1 DUF4387 domain-containing protein [Oceanobacillus luteolus]
MTKLYEYAKVLRSKNAGPFEVTLDILFEEKEKYDHVKQSGILTKERIARLYHIEVSDIHHFVFFDQALGIKITMARDISSGSAGDRDVYGAQQHAPLMNIDIDEE